MYKSRVNSPRTAQSPVTVIDRRLHQCVFISRMFYDSAVFHKHLTVLHCFDCSSFELHYSTCGGGVAACGSACTCGPSCACGDGKPAGDKPCCKGKK
ncbi:hypothetical protein KGM_201215 [Danaus plexippus plexippus]|uniref:Uncharacterized protein n=1 Tax=Danaus plexippus plexippus TaxID=278856 RepID=A0A212ESV6_DANPL|nr:hypothetical protein KGM_201215 [Danaus plexippus plexippus]